MDPEDTLREAWVEKMLPRLTAVLADDRLDEKARYSEAELRELLAFLYDMDVDENTGDLTPGQLVLQKLITMQGWDAMTASLLARTLPKLEWGRLEVASFAAAEILDVNLSTMLRNRVAGNIEVKSEHWSRHRKEAVVHWLYDILFIAAWKRQHPWTGGPVSGFPPRD